MGEQGNSRTSQNTECGRTRELKNRIKYRLQENKETQEQDKIHSVGEQRESEWNKYREQENKGNQEQDKK